MPPQKKLLILYYNFPPVKVPGAVRIHHFYRAALPWFAEIHALAAANRRFFLQDPSLETGCQHVIEVPAWDLRRLAMRKKAGNAPFVSSALKGRPLIGWFRRLLDSFPFNTLIGDGGLVYILAGYLRARRLIEKKGITHVFSTFRPYSDHIIGYLLKRRFPEVYWIADFRDLHVDPLRKNVLWPAFQRWCNRRILRRADLVTTVSEGLKRHLGKLAPRVYVLRNGMGAVGESGEGVVPFEKFTVVYTGSLYPGQQTAGPLFQAVLQMLEAKTIQRADIQLLYAGKDEAVWKEWLQQYDLSDVGRSLGLVPLKEAQLIQQRAHANLLLSWSLPDGGGILTSKVYEYLAAGKPILAIVNGEKDEELEKLIDHGIGKICYTQSPMPSKEVSLYLHSLLTSRENPFLLKNAKREEYHWEKIMETLLVNIASSQLSKFSPRSHLM